MESLDLQGSQDAMVTRVPLVWMANQGLQDQKGKRVKQGTSARGVLKASQGRTALWVPGDPRGQRASPACKGRRVMMASQGNQDFQALREKREARV